MLACALTIHAFVAARPAFRQVSYQLAEGEPWYNATFPLIVEGAPAGDFAVEFTLDLPRIHPSLFTFAPDDCIDVLIVNGQTVKNDAIPFCDFRRGRTFNLRRYLFPGSNTVVLQMRNQGWPGGLDVTVPLYDPITIILSGFLCITAVWAFGGLRRIPYARTRSLPRLLSAEDRRKCVNFATRAMMFIAGLALFRGMSDLLDRWIYELHQPYTADMGIYLAVGRGILNGLTPYVDLFENKPPGIFLLSALSLRLFNGSQLLHLLEAAILMGFPYVFLLWHFHGSSLAKERNAGVSTVFMLGNTALFSIGLALYTFLRSGEAQVESYGAFAGILFLAVVSLGRGTFQTAWLWISSILLLAAVGMKEPFVLTILAGFLVIFGWDFPVLRERFLKPLILAGILGCIALFTLGFLWPYIGVYLAEMFGHHIPQGGSVFSRAFTPQKLWLDVKDFSPWFGVNLLFMMMFPLGRQWRESADLAAFLWKIILLLAAVFLTSFAVGMGGAYYNHHFIFAAPFYAAIFFRFALDVRRSRAPRMLFWSGVNLFLISLAMFHHTTMNYERLLANFEREPLPAKHAARVVDDILDACEVDRYLFLGGNGPQPYSFTRHSPFGPMFFQYYYSLSPDRAFFRQKFLESLEQAQLIVSREYLLNTLQDEAVRYIDGQFTETPWRCAKRAMVGFERTSASGAYTFWFRTNGK